MRKGSFSLQLSSAIGEIKEGVKRKQNAIIFELGRAIIMDTPVDTGMLRGNWRWSYSPAQMEIDRQDKSGQQAISELTGFLNGFNGGQMWMLNGQPYAGVIEYDGHSKKSPHGMVRRNVARINKIAKGVK
ncbi:MAG: hypothetical protein RR390_00460 [Hafnia sp.]